MQNIKRIEDLLKNNKTFESVGNMLLFWELCNRIDTALKQGDDYMVFHYHYYARSLKFIRHKTEELPYNAVRLQFYGKKYYIYE